MQIDSMKTFCDLAETKSFTRAAQINGVTQSAVSQTITALERQFTARLIERSKRNSQLTREGHIFYDACKEILDTYESLRTKIKETQETISGKFHVAAVYSVGLHVLPPYIKAFMKKFPTVNVRVSYAHSEDVYEQVFGNAVDLGLVACPVRHHGLEIVPLQKESFVVVCHPANPLAKLKSVKLKALSGEKFVSLEPGLPTRRMLDRTMKAQKVVARHVMEFDNFQTVKRAVEIESGISIVPKSVVKEEVAARTLAAVPIEGTLTRELAAIFKRNKAMSSALKEFLGLLKKPPVPDKP
jgi:DNA-binding transcriptional LysR family regulator